MQLRHILGYLFLAFAVLLFLGETDFLFVMSPSRMPNNDYYVLMIVWVYGLVLAGGVTGFLLLRRTSRAWLWLGVGVATVAFFRYLLLPLWMRDYVGTPWRIVHGMPFENLTNLGGHIMPPILLGLGLYLAFQRVPEASTELASITRPSPTYGVLSLVLSLACFGVGILVGWVSPLGGSGGEGDSVATIILVYLGMLVGFISVIIAFVRWEKREYWAFLGFVINLAPNLLVLRFVSVRMLEGPILGLIVCLGCTVASLVTKERGRNWSLLAAVPAVFALISLVQPVLQALVTVWRQAL